MTDVTGFARGAVVVGFAVAIGVLVAQDDEAPAGQGKPLPVPSGVGPSAAAEYGWGRPVLSDEFSGSAVDTRAWAVYDSEGHAGNGRRSPAAVTVRDGLLTITGRRDGTTGGMAWKQGERKYGRWEARIRVSRACACYHPVLLLWPTGGGSGVAPKGGGGEIDYTETIDDGRRGSTHFFLHYGPENQDHQIEAKVRTDMTRWHTFAVDWTPRSISGYIDGRRWFYTADKRAQPPGPMGQTVQLDWFPEDTGRTARGVSRSAPASLQVDWIRMYAP
ncbi:glycoside hydrolase family 16 protein [Actinomadura barringtoniae]|uniref:Glycoside hydrolase family 16 protein n=1 Tax=Actinomadura barringtoniae TaxID=1427535 RepID=A0A939PS91_9ACTN|nr:glycoside hydrolase family 16 protein [Actinomadura barringtoniae]MBO2455313.1 glycoside hydrolase family 16 protein [Actinomadura barringtoniae]